MKRLFFNNINFDKLNSLVLILITFSTFRYHKKYLNLTHFNDINLIKIFGEICFLLLIFISLIYILRLSRKAIIYLLAISLFWSIASILLNYDIINFTYIKKSFQIIYCFFIFLVFINIKEKLNFKLIESLIIFIILVNTFFWFYYGLENNQIEFNPIIFTLICILLILFLKSRLKFNEKKKYFYIFLIISFLLFYLKTEFFENYVYDKNDIELFTRKNSFSWMILLFFSLILFFKGFNSNKNNQFLLLMVIIIFSKIFISSYIFFGLIFLMILFFIQNKLNFFFYISLIIMFACSLLYILIVFFYTDTYIKILNEIFNYIFNIDNLGLLVISDQNFSYDIEVSQINSKISPIGTNLYLGLIHRAAMIKIYMLNITNNIFMDVNYLMTIEYFSFYFEDPQNTGFKNEAFVKDYHFYIKDCMALNIRVLECATHHGFVGMEDFREIHPSEIYFREIHPFEIPPRLEMYIKLFDPNFLTTYLHDTRYYQKFNSPHNQYLDLINSFRFLGFILMIFMAFCALKLSKFNKSNEFFFIIILILLLLLNFDNYLFYNYFNVSYFLWMVLGLSINPNLNLAIDK